MTYRINLYCASKVIETAESSDLIGAKERTAYLILTKRATGAAIFLEQTGEVMARYGDAKLRGVVSEGIEGEGRMALQRIHTG